ncbi:hypothetical protein [Streptacidiphilus sp. MAP5-3]|uniref:hypothetical protein n=1 Tax=unclassified Streptacidiphilus TaxID=2643834 RepID=UPI003518AA27
MHRGLAALASALTVASPSALGIAAPAHAAGTQLLSCTISAEESFSPGVQMVSAPQSVGGVLHGLGQTAGPACAPAADGITSLDATFTGMGQASCFTDPALRAVKLNGTMAITWKKANGAAVGSSRVNWSASQVDLGSTVLAGTVSSGVFKGATMSVTGLSADAVISVTGGCSASSPLTSVRTTDTYLRLTQV